jgi:hypothetical protein
VLTLLISATSGSACSTPEATAAPQASVDSQDAASVLDIGRAGVGLRISPVPLDLKHKSRLAVGLGSYLVNAAGGCNDCHTHPSYAPGGDPFQGQPAMVNREQYLTGGRVFGPDLVSPNITPDANGLPAGLTFAQFKDVFRTGRDPDPAEPGRILQVMPWPVYGNLLDGDLRAIYEFLRAIPSRPDNPNPGP